MPAIRVQRTKFFGVAYPGTCVCACVHLNHIESYVEWFWIVNAIALMWEIFKSLMLEWNSPSIGQCVAYAKVCVNETAALTSKTNRLTNFGSNIAICIIYATKSVMYIIHMSHPYRVSVFSPALSNKVQEWGIFSTLTTVSLLLGGNKIFYT